MSSSARNEKLDQILRDAKPKIAAHWADCIGEIEAVTPAGTVRVDDQIKVFFERLQALPEPATQDAILMEIKTLFLKLDEVNRDFDGGLLETDERELLVTIIIDAAVIAGFDITPFEGEDPTFQFRNF